MKVSNRDKVVVGKYIIHINMTPRAWAIVIMPIQIRVDNAHGFVHIHFSRKGKKHKINKMSFDEILLIIIQHINQNNLIDNKKLWEDLS